MERIGEQRDAEWKKSTTCRTEASCYESAEGNHLPKVNSSVFFMAEKSENW